MKGLVRKHIYLVLAVFLVAIMLFIGRPGASWYGKKTDLAEFEHQLSDKEWLIDGYLDSIMQKARNRNFTEWISKNGQLLDDLNKQQGFVFYLFIADQMIYWSNNSIPIPGDSLWRQQPFYKFGNCYAEVRIRESETIQIAGLIQIKTNYPFENEFLKNGFHPSFHIGSSLSLSKDESIGYQPIFNKEGTYLFGLRNNMNLKTNQKEIWMGFLLILVLFFLLLYGRDSLKHKDLSIRNFVILSLALVFIRALAQYYHLPLFFNTLPIFQPQYFAFSYLFPSLGDLFISTTLWVYLIFIFYAKVPLKSLIGAGISKKVTIGFAWIAVILLYAHFEHYLFKHLIFDSNFEYEAYDVLNLNYFSFIGYFILLFVFLGWILLIDKAYLQFKPVLTLKRIRLLLLVLLFVTLLILWGTRNTRQIISWLFLLTMLFFWVQVRYKQLPLLSSIILLIALFSAYATYFIRKQNFSKRIEESKVLAVNLAREQDPVAEIILSEAINELKTDTVVKNLLQKDWLEFQKMVDYLQRHYFSGYLGRYNFQLTLCNKTDSVLLNDPNQEWAPCFQFFKKLVDKNGTETNLPGIYYLRNVSGGINYFAKVKISLKSGWDDVMFFMELTSKPNYEVLGYPELLLEKPLLLYENYHNLSYAKYTGNQLLNRTGSFPYAFDRSVYQFRNTEFAFFESENHDHLLYNADQGNTVIVSFPTVTFYNILISFTYIFFFLLIITFLLLIVGNRFANLVSIQLNIKNKIALSILLVLLISLVFVGGGTVFYTFRQFDRGQNELLSEKVQSVLVEVETKLSDLESIHQASPDYLNNLMVKFSNVFFTDINMYDLNGNLVSTSRKEIFERNLTGSKMNASAYRELVLNKKARLVQKEQIGELDYYSAYVPFISADRKLLAYINLPYFTKEVAFRQELMRVVVAVINIYTLLIILSIVIAVYLSSRITQPLRILRQRMSMIDLSKENEKISYEGKDEMAELVYEYNRMLEELSKSVQMLAKSERESAWREMARQIAHEIKNPLTPMKLSIQLLERAWQNKEADFDERFKRFSNNLIEQIDSLSSIATAFSQFAQMPKARSEKVNLIERIYQSTELFKECTYAQVKYEFSDEFPIYVKADNERMLQVFNNLVKNAIQAIPKEQQGEVTIRISQTESSVVVEVHDTGTGIAPELEPKMFQPNFTTKSSGTGLGLAIVKSIVEEFGGAIWFESKAGEGTSFFVSFPVYSNN
ncbi:MAG TPA: hypothetical protein DCQ26_19790 [Marinilabiliales bacterium]|nr:MAG: hypothetical protein A2W96_17715 [Bacteroidetes bacterium GWD2_40_43]OFX90477.1 MAG: hypothetical protein A2W97_01685 [Bacteroidetes bacterium GWE2_40_63]OFY17277.1 MAG: hypothetical protein A2W88_15180 [Bacteroidetes bacterium GWF2_40_13]OFZ29109.1 MAG: hypothetical protein A2437_16145 [Bacteroidetes bacterium RIFOXYC2_FULL_40_12]HAN00842.1 hypothetical protein [Marinilabiliales bacterium]